MRIELLQHLRIDGQPLTLEVYQQDDGHVLEGVLRDATGRWSPIDGGVPCLLRDSLRPDFTAFAQEHGLPSPVASAPAGQSRPAADTEQAQTTVTFSDKWQRFQDYGLQPSQREPIFTWYCQKLGLPDHAALEQFYQPRRRILEVGPGSGFNSRFMAEHTCGEVFAVDISAAAHTTFRNTRHLRNCHAVQADLMDLPFPDGHFDFIIADGVLHHTPDTRRAVAALVQKLQPGGQFFFYIYRRMGAARAFCDQHLRQHLSKLSPEECYRACEGITELGRELSRLNVTVTLEKPIPLLGIPAGTHDVQRLIYYNFLKCFWNEAFDYNTNNMVNFDWYHPHNAWQHTEEEVTGWLAELGITDYAFHEANPNGICVLLRKA
jgi:SAM-dependent methyltransferase